MLRPDAATGQGAAAASEGLQLDRPNPAGPQNAAGPAEPDPEKEGRVLPERSSGGLELDFSPRTRVIFGRGKIAALGEVARDLKFSRTLVVSDAGVVQAGHVERGLESLRGAGVETVLFDGVEENPTTVHVERGLEVARQHAVDSIVGLGGGSSMDCAKGINFLYTNGGTMADYLGVGKASEPMLPMIAVPTTAGTGSETQSFALISDPTTRLKMACGDVKATCRVAVLDPELTLSLPQFVTFTTGLDALSHAVESFVTTRRTPVSMAFSREAWRLLSPAFERVLRDANDIEARGDMLLGASLAGLAIENSMLGAAHALANPLTAAHGIAHGVAIGLMLPHVVRFNGHACDGDYAQLVALDPRCPDADSPSESLARRLEALRETTGLPSCLTVAGVEAGQIAGLARTAAQQWTGRFNPRTVNAADLEALYRCAL